MKLVPNVRHRPLREIAVEIACHWPKVSPYAKPYLDAMADLDQIEDVYILDSARGVVLYFLANAQAWRGEHARRIKAELKTIVANCDDVAAAANSRAAYGIKKPKPDLK